LFDFDCPADDLSRFSISTSDKTEHILQVRGPEIFYSLQDYDGYLRGMVKHGDLPEAVAEAYQDARARLREMVCDPWGEF
jgi:hypothetical protein